MSTRGRYAVRMLLDLVEHGGNGYVALKDVAERQGVSKQYLEQIVTLLGTADILTATRGRGGGYKMTKEPPEITVGEVLRLTEDGLAPVACLSGKKNTCKRAKNCKTLPMWEAFEKNVNEFFDGITLQMLLDEELG
ncbi:MAG: Rrf2 family transcriptional regulator [Coriobacteriales bacterium]|nr:Rrf2 family transcriptional regulator [Coriobacteriales bacterium]